MVLHRTIFYFVTAVSSVLRNAMQGLGETVIPLVSSALEMIGKVVIAVTLVPLLGFYKDSQYSLNICNKFLY